MFRPVLALVAALWATAPAHAASDPDTENRQRVAAAVEWMVAHCPPEGIPAITVAMGAMIANGSNPADMDAARRWLREHRREVWRRHPGRLRGVRRELQAAVETQKGPLPPEGKRGPVVGAEGGGNGPLAAAGEEGRRPTISPGRAWCMSARPGARSSRQPVPAEGGRWRARARYLVTPVRASWAVCL